MVLAIEMGVVFVLLTAILILAGPANYISGMILALMIQIFIRWKDL